MNKLECAGVYGWECAGVCSCVRVYVGVCGSVQECAKLCRSVRDCVGVYESVQKCTGCPTYFLPFSKAYILM